MSRGTTTDLFQDEFFFPNQNVYATGQARRRALEVSTNARLLGALQVGIGQSLANMGDLISEQLTPQLKGLAAAFKERAADGERRTEMFRQIGQDAQRSVSASYGQFVTRQEGPASRTHYRAGEGRLANGVLRRALNNSDFFTASPDGLVFGNTKMLDREARHWHRLAFGAGDAGEGSFEQFTVNLNGLTVAALGFNETASPSFLMPAGLFSDPATGAHRAYGANARGADLFAPLGGARGTGGLRPTRGIVGKPFLEAGLRRIARDLPTALEAYTNTLVREATAGMGYGADLATRTTLHMGPLNGGFTRELG